MYQKLGQNWHVFNGTKHVQNARHQNQTCKGVEIHNYMFWKLFACPLPPPPRLYFLQFSKKKNLADHSPFSLHYFFLGKLSDRSSIGCGAGVGLYSKCAEVRGWWRNLIFSMDFSFLYKQSCMNIVALIIYVMYYFVEIIGLDKRVVIPESSSQIRWRACNEITQHNANVMPGEFFCHMWVWHRAPFSHRM